MQSYKKYAFLDRDGTLIYEPQDTFQVDSVEKLQILDGVIEGLKTLKAAGYRLILVSNQNGVGAPSFPRENFERPQNRMIEIFHEYGIEFDRVFICPHMPEDNCACRKPKTGLVDMFWQKQQKLADLKKSFMCGDRDTDRQFAENLGIHFVSIETNGTFPQVINILNAKI